MLEVIVSGHRQLPRKDYWLPYLSKLNCAGSVLNTTETRNAISDGRACLLVYEFELGIFEKGTLAFDDGLTHVTILSTMAHNKGIPVLGVTDKSIFKDSSAPERLAQATRYCIEQPVTNGEMDNAVRQLIEMKADVKYKPPIVVQNYTHDFFRYFTEEARKAYCRVTLCLEPGKTFQLKNYRLTRGTSGMGDEWMTFMPDSITYLSSLAMMLRELRAKYDEKRADGKRTTLELGVRK
ncbi:MAG TPA: hypothetical protein VLJ21_04740 [Candidatus Binatia bacterium]|nr:hypothetical protein [Candidatus Binatia bacterium]